jgi:hypothetical protein
MDKDIYTNMNWDIDTDTPYMDANMNWDMDCIHGYFLSVS